MKSKADDAKTRTRTCGLIVLSWPCSLFCQQNVIRRHFRHGSISVDTLMVYMYRMTWFVRSEAKDKLRKHIAVVLYGWSGGATQYVAVFVTLPATNPSGYEKVRLALAPMGDKDSDTAEEHSTFWNLFSECTAWQSIAWLPLWGQREKKPGIRTQSRSEVCRIS